MILRRRPDSSSATLSRDCDRTTMGLLQRSPIVFCAFGPVVKCCIPPKGKSHLFYLCLSYFYYFRTYMKVLDLEESGLKDGNS